MKSLNPSPVAHISQRCTASSGAPKRIRAATAEMRAKAAFLFLLFLFAFVLGQPSLTYFILSPFPSFHFIGGRRYIADCASKCGHRSSHAPRSNSDEGSLAGACVPPSNLSFPLSSSLLFSPTTYDHSPSSLHHAHSSHKFCVRSPHEPLGSSLGAVPISPPFVALPPSILFLCANAPTAMSTETIFSPLFFSSPALSFASASSFGRSVLPQSLLSFHSSFSHPVLDSLVNRLGLYLQSATKVAVSSASIVTFASAQYEPSPPLVITGANGDGETLTGVDIGARTLRLWATPNLPRTATSFKYIRCNLTPKGVLFADRRRCVLVAPSGDPFQRTYSFEFSHGTVSSGSAIIVAGNSTYDDGSTTCISCRPFTVLIHNNTFGINAAIKIYGIFSRGSAVSISGNRMSMNAPNEFIFIDHLPLPGQEVSAMIAIMVGNPNAEFTDICIQSTFSIVDNTITMHNMYSSQLHLLSAIWAVTPVNVLTHGEYELRGNRVSFMNVDSLDCTFFSGYIGFQVEAPGSPSPAPTSFYSDSTRTTFQWQYTPNGKGISWTSSGGDVHGVVIVTENFGSSVTRFDGVTSRAGTQDIPTNDAGAPAPISRLYFCSSYVPPPIPKYQQTCRSLNKAFRFAYNVTNRTVPFEDPTVPGFVYTYLYQGHYRDDVTGFEVSWYEGAMGTDPVSGGAVFRFVWESNYPVGAIVAIPHPFFDGLGMEVVEEIPEGATMGSVITGDWAPADFMEYLFFCYQWGTPTIEATATPTADQTPSLSAPETASASLPLTASGGTQSPTESQTASQSLSQSVSESDTATSTHTESLSLSESLSPSDTRSGGTPSSSPSVTSSSTHSVSLTKGTPSGTASETPSVTTTFSQSASLTPTSTASPTNSPSLTEGTPSLTASPTPTHTASPTKGTPSRTGSDTPTPTRSETPTLTATATVSTSQSLTANATATETNVRTLSFTSVRTPSATNTTLATLTVTLVPTPTQSFAFTSTATLWLSRTLSADWSKTPSVPRFATPTVSSQSLSQSLEPATTPPFPSATPSGNATRNITDETAPLTVASSAAAPSPSYPSYSSPTSSQNVSVLLTRTLTSMSRKKRHTEGSSSLSPATASPPMHTESIGNNSSPSLPVPEEETESIDNSPSSASLSPNASDYRRHATPSAEPFRSNTFLGDDRIIFFTPSHTDGGRPSETVSLPFSPELPLPSTSEEDNATDITTEVSNVTTDGSVANTTTTHGAVHPTFTTPGEFIEETTSTTTTADVSTNSTTTDDAAPTTTERGANGTTTDAEESSVTTIITTLPTDAPTDTTNVEVGTSVTADDTSTATSGETDGGSSAPSTPPGPTEGPTTSTDGTEVSSPPSTTDVSGIEPTPTPDGTSTGPTDPNPSTSEGTTDSAETTTTTTADPTGTTADPTVTTDPTATATTIATGSSAAPTSTTAALTTTPPPTCPTCPCVSCPPPTATCRSEGYAHSITIPLPEGAEGVGLGYDRSGSATDPATGASVRWAPSVISGGLLWSSNVTLLAVQLGGPMGLSIVVPLIPSQAGVIPAAILATVGPLLTSLAFCFDSCAAPCAGCGGGCGGGGSTTTATLTATEGPSGVVSTVPTPFVPPTVPSTTPSPSGGGPNCGCIGIGFSFPISVSAGAIVTIRDNTISSSPQASVKHYSGDGGDGGGAAAMGIYVPGIVAVPFLLGGGVREGGGSRAHNTRGGGLLGALIAGLGSPKNSEDSDAFALTLSPEEESALLHRFASQVYGSGGSACGARSSVVNITANAFSLFSNAPPLATPSSLSPSTAPSTAAAADGDGGVVWDGNTSPTSFDGDSDTQRQWARLGGLFGGSSEPLLPFLLSGRPPVAGLGSFAAAEAPYDGLEEYQKEPAAQRFLAEHSPRSSDSSGGSSSSNSKDSGSNSSALLRILAEVLSRYGASAQKHADAGASSSTSTSTATTSSGDAVGMCYAVEDNAFGGAGPLDRGIVAVGTLGLEGSTPTHQQQGTHVADGSTFRFTSNVLSGIAPQLWFGGPVSAAGGGASVVVERNSLLCTSLVYKPSGHGATLSTAAAAGGGDGPAVTAGAQCRHSEEADGAALDASLRPFGAAFFWFESLIRLTSGAAISVSANTCGGRGGEPTSAMLLLASAPAASVTACTTCIVAVCGNAVFGAQITDPLLGSIVRMVSAIIVRFLGFCGDVDGWPTGPASRPPTSATSPRPSSTPTGAAESSAGARVIGGRLCFGARCFNFFYFPMLLCTAVLVAYV